MSEIPISVVISASEHPGAVQSCLESVLRQTLAPAEIIVASAVIGEIAEPLRRWSSRASIPIRHITHGRPPSVAADVNAALAAVRSPSVSFVAAENRWPATLLARLQGGRSDRCWSYSSVTTPTHNDPLREVVEHGTAADTLLCPRELAEDIGELDASVAPLELWDLAVGLALRAPGRRIISDDSTSASPHTGRQANVAAGAQVLRKYATALKAALGDFGASAATALGSISNDSAVLSRGLQSLTLPYLQRNDQAGSELAFLVSLPRSGSTLLQRILAGHPDIGTLPEPWIMLNPCHGLHGEKLSGDYEPAMASAALEGFLTNSGGGTALYDSAVRAMGEQLYGTALAGSGKRIFLDKTPRYFHILPELRRVYPAARFIFLLRHPLAVMTSALHTWFEGDVDAFLNNNNAVDCFDGPIRLYETLSELGEAAVCVQYEKLVTDPAGEIRRLCNRIGIAYCEDMLNYDGTAMPPSEFGDQVNIARHTRPVADFVDGWRDRFRDPATAALARDLLERLGADVFNTLGYDHGDALAAINSGAAAVSSAAESADALTLAGEQHFSRGDNERARAAFERALELHPRFATAHNNLGVLSSSLGETDAAIEHFIAAVDCDPGDRNAVVNLIECAIAADRLSDTLDSLGHYLAAMPEDREIAVCAAQIADAVESAVRARVQAGMEPQAAAVDPLPRAPVVLIPNEQPRLTLVTPSYNQGEYLEACIDSVLSQNYPNLEYIIMDGGSTDQSVSIIKRYQKYLTHWQTERDDGQYAAIETGFKRSTGDIMAWLNSDDKYHPDALWKVSYAFMTRPEVEWLTGLYTFWDQHGTLTGVLDPVYWSRRKQLDANDMTTIQQESTFWRRSLWNKAGARLATDLYYAGDFDLWTRFFAHAKLHTLEWTLGGYRYHEGQKVGLDASAYTAEAEVLREREIGRLTAAGVVLCDEIPRPIRLDDDALIELAQWRDASPPVQRYVRRGTKTATGTAHARKGKTSGAAPTMNIVTSLRAGGAQEQQSAVHSWLAAGWRVTSVNDDTTAEDLRPRFPDVDFVVTDEITHVEEDIDAVRFRSLLAAAATSSADHIGIIKPDVIVDDAAYLAGTIAGYSDRALIYGDKLAINSTNVLDGIADGYGYFFCAPKILGSFTPGDLTFGQDWWVHWLLMTAIAKGYPVHKIERTCAYRIKKYVKPILAEQVISSRACISSVLAQYLPQEFKTIPSLKLSFDIESGDFEKFARSFVGSRAA